MSDLLLERRKDGFFDLCFENGDLLMGEFLKNAVLLSIGSMARKVSGFSGKLQDDGWWGEPTFEGDKWGSLVHTLFQNRGDSNTVLLARQYVKNSLQWLIDDGVASDVNVDVRCDAESLDIDVAVLKGEKVEDYRFNMLWNEVL